MAREVFVTNGHDYSKYIEEKGMSWKRDDLDSDDTGRDTLDGLMHRSKITDKRNLSYKLFNAPEEVLRRLDTDLQQETFSATIRDLHGVQTRTFYCSSFQCNLYYVDEDDNAQWGDATFNIHEV